MKIIAEQPWSHVLLERDGEWILTLMLHSGAVEHDLSVRLTEQERQAVQAQPASLAALLARIRDDRAAFRPREISPPVWP
ncbi:hypothetical protein FNU76_01355 [Chitinimonas arctica]|uniref:Uncharacterized protein n=1 Tax=Chitinimonas arctica TaxID=2594795 RepID=A0A516SAN8_9NEIS|nr:hypothetical protein [Chitinimonas arctica]QDQ25108.1 hypothetical protein FNU76_01355 [Chitinimonas arctica]